VVRQSIGLQLSIRPLMQLALLASMRSADRRPITLAGILQPDRANGFGRSGPTGCHHNFVRPRRRASGSHPPGTGAWITGLLARRHFNIAIQCTPTEDEIAAERAVAKTTNVVALPASVLRASPSPRWRTAS
jgi:hypothetical protein